MTATFYVGDAIEVMGKLPEKSVDLVLSSPPFLALRSYLPSDHPDKALEGGSQATPGEYIDWLLDVVEACERVLAPHGSLCFELGDTYSGSGGAGGDYADDGLRDGQAKFRQQRVTPDLRRSGDAAEWAMNDGTVQISGGRGWPLAKSLSLIPESFRFAMVYGINPHTGRRTAPWRLRNVIRWVRPNPPVGALGDKFRPATSELMVFCKAKDRFFDLDAVRTPNVNPNPGRVLSTKQAAGDYQSRNRDGYSDAGDEWMNHPAGSPPLDWWNIPGDHLKGIDWLAQLLTERDLNDSLDELPPIVQERYRKDAWHILRRASDESLTSNHTPLDWWNIPPGGYPGAHYAVWPPELLIKPIKAMSPEKVCVTCGEPSRRIVETTGYYRKDGTVFEGTMYADGSRSVKRELRTNHAADYGSDTGRSSIVQTLGFSDCGHDDWRPGLILDCFAGSGTTLAVATGHGRDAIGIDLDERNYDLALDRVGPFILTKA